MTFQVIKECASVLISYKDAVCASLIPQPEYTAGEEVPGFESVDEFNVFKNEILKLELRSEAVPKSIKQGPVPYAYDDEVQQEFKQTIEDGIIIEERDPTNWCSPMLIRRKSNGKV